MSFPDTVTIFPTKWKYRFLDQAELVASWSKDPSTKVGAVIVRPDKTIVSQGYNGFPRGVLDDPETYADRTRKYEIVVHAEDNALITSREPLHGYCIVTTLPPCSRCAARIIQSGIKSSIAIAPMERWMENCNLGRLIMQEAGIEVEWIPQSVWDAHKIPPR